MKYFALVVCLIFSGGFCCAKDGYLIVPVPDTIVAPTPIDLAVYSNTAEFFTPYIVNEINKTHYMHAPTVTDVRNRITKDYWLTKSAAKAMDDFRRYYILDFNFAKKVANLYNTNLVMLLTSTIDANNYIMRRTWWTFFEIPGSSALDPALKINIYTVIIDTNKEQIVWSKTYQKTISTVENRIVPIGYSPQTEQLQKMKDYSVYLAPRVAQSIQDTLLTAEQKLLEPNMIHTDYGSIDNVFTKRYRTLRKETVDATVIPAAKTREYYGKAREKYLEQKEQWEIQREEKARQKELEKQQQDNNIEPVRFLWFKKKTAPEQQIIEEQISPVQVNSSPKAINNEQLPIDKNLEQKADSDLKNTQNNSKVATPVTTNKNENNKLNQSQELKPAVNVINNNQEKTNNVSNTVQKKGAASSDNVQKKLDTNIKKINKNKDNAVITDELPVDALIYTQPNNYNQNEEFLPLKPRLREINIDDTVNSF